MYLGFGHSLNRVVPFRIVDKAVRYAIDNQYRPRRIAFVALALEPFESICPARSVESSSGVCT